MLILSVSSEVTHATLMCAVMVFIAGLFIGGIALWASDSKLLTFSMIILLAVMPILFFGPQEDHIFVDGRSVDWEAIARQEYRTVNIEGTIVELVKKNDKRNDG